MFTGIITDIGKIIAISGEKERRLTIETNYDSSTIDLGASIACAGVCLTVVQKGENSFSVDASAETLSRTNLGEWEEGTCVNLERALSVGDELGGHIVTGHIDAVAEILDIREEGESLRFTFSLPVSLAAFIAEKGTITLDGVSLTVNEVEANCFGVNIIPHTRTHTTFGAYKKGSRVNIEIDILARYLSRMREIEG